MRHIVIAMSSSDRIGPDNPLGRAVVTLDEIATLCESGQIPDIYSGITLQRFCGSLADGRVVGERVDGWVIHGMTVGSFDDYVPTADDLFHMDRIRAAGFSVLCYVGFPLQLHGLLAMRNWRTDLYDVACDMSGANIATSLLLSVCPGMTIEPCPRPRHRPGWFTPDIPSFTMRRYFERLRDEDGLPPPGPRHHLSFNNNPTSPNYWHPGLAEAAEKAGYTVNVPVVVSGVEI